MTYVTAWRGSRKCSKFSQSFYRQRFSKPGRDENEKYPALVEVFSLKQAAEYFTKWEAFTSAKHARSLPGKNIESYLKVVFLFLTHFGIICDL